MARHLLISRGHLFERNGKLYWSISRGTRARTRGMEAVVFAASMKYWAWMCLNKLVYQQKIAMVVQFATTSSLKLKLSRIWVHKPNSTKIRRLAQPLHMTNGVETFVFPLVDWFVILLDLGILLKPILDLTNCVLGSCVKLAYLLLAWWAFKKKLCKNAIKS